MIVALARFSIAEVPVAQEPGAPEVIRAKLARDRVRRRHHLRELLVGQRDRRHGFLPVKRRAPPPQMARAAGPLPEPIPLATMFNREGKSARALCRRRCPGPD